VADDVRALAELVEALPGARGGCGRVRERGRKVFARLGVPTPNGVIAGEIREGRRWSSTAPRQLRVYPVDIS